MPGWPCRIEREVSSIDLVPTILKLVNEDAPKYLDGIDLGPMVHGEPTQRRILSSDTWRYNGFAKLEVDQSAAFDGARKFIFDRLTGGIYYENQAARSQVQTAATLVGYAPFDALSGSYLLRRKNRLPPGLRGITGAANHPLPVSCPSANSDRRRQPPSATPPLAQSPMFPRPDLQSRGFVWNWGVGCCIGRSC